MWCRYVPRRCIARRFKVVAVAALIFGLFHFLLVGQQFREEFYRPTEEILIRQKRKHETDNSHFKARIIIDKTELVTPPTKTSAGSSSSTKGMTSSTTSIDKCRRGRPVVFLKTHKTASTTLTNIFLRYAEKNKLLVGLPPERHWELGGYPAKFSTKLVDPAAAEYEVLAHHFRYSDEVEKVTPKNAFKVTVLRDPVQNFESGFGFFRDYPYVQWLGDKPNINKFLDNPNYFFNTSTPWHFRAKNYMAFDLGLEFDRDDPKYIEQAIKTIEDRFHLVMITDRFEESVILLKEELCLTLEDVVYLKLKVRKENDRKSLDARLQNAIRTWNKLDSALYDHFFKILDQKIEKFGRTKMQSEIAQLNQRIEYWNSKCIERYSQFDDKPWIARMILKPKAGHICEKMSWGEVLFGDTLRKTQSKTMKMKMKAIQPHMEDLISEMKNIQVKILGKEAVKFSSGNAGRHK